MKVILREDESGVSEVIGTILILAMTVVLFSVIIIWVTNIPTPTAQTRLDIQSTMLPYLLGANITLLHQGGEALQPVPTVIYVTYYKQASSTTTTDVIILHRYSSLLVPKNGILDGTDSVWDLGERWVYQSGNLDTTKAVSIVIVDLLKSSVVWNGDLNAPAGSRPPVFIDKWADGTPSTDAIDPVQAGLGFVLYVKVADPDGDLNPAKVFATWYVPGGSGLCLVPYLMLDNGVPPDKVAGDGVFTLGSNPCMKAPLYPLLSWAGSYILLNATDYANHQTTTRFVLNVVPASSTSGGGGGTIPSQLWQYIGYVQIRTGEVWLSNLTDPGGYGTTNQYLPYRVQKSWIGAGALFHFKMANHGNTTIFIDGYTQGFFQNTQSAGGIALYITAPCDPTKRADLGGLAAYPGTGAITDFEYAHSGLPAGCAAGLPTAVFDINTVNQETGGTPYVVLIYPKTPFSLGSAYNWPNSATYYISILVSGMAGPANYTYAMLTQTGQPNPRGCAGLGPSYNPYNHLNDPIAACRSTWYAQVIPFVGMTVI